MNWTFPTTASRSAGLQTTALPAQDGAIDHIEPIKVGGLVVGAVCTGKRIDNGFVKELSREIGAELSLVSRTGEIAASSKPWGSTPDSAAIREAFQHKDSAFRSIEGSRLTQAYLPILIVDDGWVLIAEIDSSPAYRAIGESNKKAALITLGSIAAAILVTLLLLRHDRQVSAKQLA